MKKVLLVTLIILMAAAFTACGLPSLDNLADKVQNSSRDEDAYNQDEDYDDDYNDYEDEYDDYGDGVDGSNSSNPDYDEDEDEDALPTGWWSKPFHMKGITNISFSSEDVGEEFEIVYDGTDILYYEADRDGYYCHIKDGVMKNYGFDADNKSIFIWPSEDYPTMQHQLINNLPTIRSIINSCYQVDLALKENDESGYVKTGSESKNGYSCDVYEFTFPLVSKTILWIDKDTGVLVWKQQQYLADETVIDEFQLTSFETKSVPTITDIFNLDDYGGDPEEIAKQEEEFLLSISPVPTFGTILSQTYSSNTYIYQMNWTKDDVLAYIEVLKSSGFTENETVTDYAVVYTYVSYNTDGNRVSLSWYADENDGNNGYIQITRD